MVRVMYHFHLEPNCEAEFETMVSGWAHAMKHHRGFIAISLYHTVEVKSKWEKLQPRKLRTNAINTPVAQTMINIRRIIFRFKEAKERSGIASDA